MCCTVMIDGLSGCIYFLPQHTQLACLCYTCRKPSVAPAPLCCTAQECVRRKARPPRHAFLTTARSSPYVAAVKGLACSLAKSNPGSHLIIMGGASDSERLSAEQLDYLQHNAGLPGLTVEYKIVRDIDFPNYDNPRFHLNWIKLQAWNLTKWDAIIMVSSAVCLKMSRRKL
eukprot:GHUV01034054.1.p1 GENE.GHUV01034054.1~~GHUV01034054.1.p1  ORF type:complete len:172 (-),score=37.96 GHUV01034054.1:249-764(-)